MRLNNWKETETYYQNNNYYAGRPCIKYPVEYPCFINLILLTKLPK